MKCIILYRGIVTCVLPGGTRIARLWRPHRKDSEIIVNLKRNYSKGFKVGQLFEARVMKDKEKKAFVKVKKWTPQPLGPRTIARIKREVDELLKDIPDDI